MESVTLCDLLQNWPEVEKRLATEGELTVTRDGMAVALLTSPRPARVKKAAKRFDSAVHAALIQKIWSDKKPPFTTDQKLGEERAERAFRETGGNGLCPKRSRKHRRDSR
jgi:antitoxin (DNA-binding transcriptional repressor) of toxin-antitoxin stability system